MNLSRISAHALTLCFLSSASTFALAQATIKMVFGAPLTTLHLPIIVAEQEGYFKAAGLTVEKIFLAGDANSLRAVASGDADAASTGTLTLISAAAAGSDIRGIFSYQPIADYNIIAKDPRIIPTIKYILFRFIFFSGSSGTDSSIIFLFP